MESIKDMRNIGCLDDLPLDAHFFTKDEYDYYIKKAGEFKKEELLLEIGEEKGIKSTIIGRVIS